MVAYSPAWPACQNGSGVEVGLVDGRGVLVVSAQELADQLAQRWDEKHGGDDVEAKTCSRCGEAKPPTEFHKGHAKCKPCFNEHAKAKRNGEKPTRPPRRPAPAPVEDAWRDVFANPTLAQLEALQAFLDVASLDETARISKAIAGA